MKKLYFMIVFLGISLQSHAQFNAILYDFTPLTHRCDGSGGPISHGYLGYIYWDQNNNGPDDADIIPIVGNGFGQCNFNQIDMGSGEDLLGIPGGFATDPSFTISTNTPTPSRYYVVVVGQSVQWTSVVFTIADGLNEYDLSQGWTCESTVLPCDEPTLFFIDTPNGIEYFSDLHSYCISLCANAPLQICYGPLEFTERPNSLSLVFPGCQNIGGDCDVQCQPANSAYDSDAWEYNEIDHTWCNWIYPVDNGCACFFEDSHIPVQFGSFTAEPRDQSMLLTWTTHSERSIRNFTLLRDGVPIHDAEPVNTAVGATYTYLDESLENGRAYQYAINVVNMDGSVQAWPTSTSATPNIDAAVISEYALHQNYPNPFNPITNLVFDVVTENNVNLSVYNLMGQNVASLINGTVSAGRHTVSFDAANFTSGTYFYTVKIGNEFTATKKMLLVK